MKEEEIKIINDYLLKVTTFQIISKDTLKKEVCDLIDKRFKFIEKDIKKANDALYNLKTHLTHQNLN